MPEYWGANVTLSYDPETDKWSGVVVDDLTEFSGSLFSVLNELDNALAATYSNSN